MGTRQHAGGSEDLVLSAMSVSSHRLDDDELCHIIIPVLYAATDYADVIYAVICADVRGDCGGENVFIDM